MTARKAGDRVLIIPLGVAGTITRVRDDGRIAAQADCSTQPAVWLPAEISDLPAKAGAS